MMKNFIEDGNSAVTADYDDDVGYKNNKIIILSYLLVHDRRLQQMSNQILACRKKPASYIMC